MAIIHAIILGYMLQCIIFNVGILHTWGREVRHDVYRIDSEGILSHNVYIISFALDPSLAQRTVFSSSCALAV